MASSVTIPVGNILNSSESGGRFDFDDGGTYYGGWQNNKAHGFGVCTGLKNVGKYSGSWNFGYEMSGVYEWKNGAVYEGRWQNGKRHGVGVEYINKWIYKGEWSQGFKGRYGVKLNSSSAVKYEGTWANGLQDGYGSETYSDGGFYQGHMCRGLRHGYGVRKSAPYGDSQLNNPNRNNNGQITSSGMSTSMMLHSNSLQSSNSLELDDDAPKAEDGFKPNVQRTLTSKNGFVLVAKPLDVPMSAISGNQSDSRQGRRNSLTSKLPLSRIPGSNQTVSLLRRLKKQKSTSDLDALMASKHNNSSSSGAAAGKLANSSDELPVLQFSLSPEELDISDPSTVETYTGEWNQDRRNGHGVCERSDGLKYEGQWHNDMKFGYGVTTFKDGTKEEGKYKNNILIVDSKVRRFLHLGQSNMRQRIEDALKMAHKAQEMALKKAEIAETRAATARDKAEQATTASLEAQRDSQIAHAVAAHYMDSQQQAQLSYAPAIQLEPPTSFFPDQQPSLVEQHHQQQQQQQMSRLSPSPLKMRRPSTSQQLYNDSSSQQVVAGQQQQHLQAGVSVEPFNGRRGSFRGGSQHSTTSSSYRPNMYQSQAGPAVSFASQSRAPAGDPFNDLFDHYHQPTSFESSGQSTGRSSNLRRLMKQTSLDQQQHHQVQAEMRSSSPFADRRSATPSERLRKHRMSSLDHAEENQQLLSLSSSYNNHQSDQSAQQQQLKHLVTSGEELIQQPSQPIYETNLDKTHSSGFTPTGSSYILPQSTNSSFLGQQTPSPDANSSSLRQHPQQQQQLTNNSYLGGQRDAQSLADEQLYMLGQRPTRPTRCEYSRNDFTISSAPRPAQSCMRRTASLSRVSPAATLASSRMLRSPRDTPDELHLPLIRSESSSSNQPARVEQLEPSSLDELSASRATLNASSCGSGSQLMRKPSLQVRYDPQQLGGLMTREEVAALSHAQREHQRIQTELAERRAQQPLLHLLLSVKEFITSQRLIISVLIFNFCLIKMFADLIV